MRQSSSGGCKDAQTKSIKMSTLPLPPTYTQLPETQLIITPSNNATQFQNGFLGADETTSVDGEVHVKGASPGDWARL